MPRKKTCPDLIKKTCEWCSKEYDCKWASRKKQRYCSKVCANADPKTKNKIIHSQNETFFEKYGCHPMQTEETKNNLKKSMLEKYGVDWGSKIETHTQKLRKTKLLRYGNEKYTNVKKIKETMLKRYGVTNSQKNLGIKIKANKTFKKNHFNNQLLPLLKSKNLIPEFTEEQYTNNHWTEKYNFRCEKCDHRFQYSLYHKNMLFCPKCSPFGKNKPESEIYDFLSGILPGENIKIRDRTILSGKELDFYIPSKNFAIEHDGLYWHSDTFKNLGNKRHNKYSHLNKLKACAFHGVNLVRIFEDEWVYKNETIKFILKDHLGLFKLLLPEKYEIKELTKKEYDDFVNRNWINLSDKITSIRLGLVIGENLVSVIGVRKSKKNPGQYEIMDVVQNMDFSYNKSSIAALFDYFIKKYNPTKIIKYIDRRIEKWDYLLSYGFSIKGFGEPRWYLLSEDYKTRIYDTRTYIGDKIWDCGYIKMELNLSP